MNKILRTGIIALMCTHILAACDTDSPVEQKQSSNTAASQATAVAPTSNLNEFAKQLPADAPVMNVTTEAGYPPFAFFDKQGNPIGIDVDIINAIAADQNMKAVVRHQAWDKIFSTVLGADNKDQAVIAALGVEGREGMAIEMSDYYLLSPNTILVNENSSIGSVNDLEGKHISILSDSVTLKQLESMGVKPGRVSETKASYLGFQSLARGEVDAIIDDNIVMSYKLLNYPELKFRKVLFPYKEKQGLVIVVGKGNTELLNKINTGLANIRANGTYDKILAKWGLDPKIVTPSENK